MTVLVFIIVLGVLIFVHELGHFMAAKAVGIGVPRFSIGLGPISPFRFRRGETEYVLSWIPLGGYVKMASKEEQAELEALEGGQIDHPFPPEKLFENKPLAARILVISAGVVMNALFAWLTYAGLLLGYGQAKDPTTAIARVDAEVLPASAQALAGLPFGTEVVRVNGREVPHRDALLRSVIDPENRELRFEFAAADPVVVDVSEADEETRVGIARALVPLWKARITSVAGGDAASKAGFQDGDLVEAIDGTPVRTWEEMVAVVEESAGRTLSFSVVRDGTPLTIECTPGEGSRTDPVTGEERKVGLIGVYGPMIDPIRIPVGPVDALIQGGRQTVSLTGRVLGVLRDMLLRKVSLRELGGPVLIAQVSAQAARRGLEELLALMAFLSINLAVLNLLPIPVLDGGHLVFLGLEGVRGGRPVPKELRQRLTLIGFYLLMALMTFVLVNDFLR